jgi:hypothetical protein
MVEAILLMVVVLRSAIPVMAQVKLIQNFSEKSVLSFILLFYIGVGVNQSIRRNN